MDSVRSEKDIAEVHPCYIDYKGANISTKIRKEIKYYGGIITIWWTYSWYYHYCGWNHCTRLAKNNCLYYWYLPYHYWRTGGNSGIVMSLSEYRMTLEMG